MKAILIFCFGLCSLSAFPQFKESFYALDADWQQTTADKAKYLLWIHLDSAGNWEYNYYHMWGPMIKQETYKDHDGTLLNGLTCYYYTTGNLDSLGHYRDGKKEGKFYKYDLLPRDSLRLTREYVYANDRLAETVDPPKKARDKAGEADSTGNEESRFPGGAAEWAAYLQKNLRYPTRATGNKIEGTVLVSFQIDEQGNVVEPVVSRSVEYSLDREAIRLIMDSGKWEPATKDGLPVPSCKTEPLVFSLTVSK